MKENRLIGTVQWRGYKYKDGKVSIHKVFGIVQTIDKKDYFFHGNNFIFLKKALEEFDIMTFEGVQKGEKLEAVKCRIYHKIGNNMCFEWFLENLKDEPDIIQENLLEKVLDYIIEQNTKTKTEILNTSFYSYQKKKTVNYKKVVEKNILKLMKYHIS